DSRRRGSGMLGGAKAHQLSTGLTTLSCSRSRQTNGTGHRLSSSEQAADDVVEHRRQEDAEQRHAEHPSENCRAERPPHLPPRPPAGADSRHIGHTRITATCRLQLSYRAASTKNTSTTAPTKAIHGFCNRSCNVSVRLASRCRYASSLHSYAMLRGSSRWASS